MDRSFLSSAAVVQASRNFVCIRLSTYEDGEEAEFLRKVYGGEIANTVFAMLSPDAEQMLSRAGRGPRFRSAQAMADEMNSMVAKQYPSAPKQKGSDTTLPEVKNLELALNVAACDSLPLVVAIGENDSEVDQLRKQLLPIVWSHSLQGQFIVATAKTTDDLRAITKLPKDATGLFVLEPDAYGLMGRVISPFSVDQEGTEVLTTAG